MEPGATRWRGVLPNGTPHTRPHQPASFGRTALRTGARLGVDRQVATENQSVTSPRRNLQSHRVLCGLKVVADCNSQVVSIAGPKSMRPARGWWHGKRAEHHDPCFRALIIQPTNRHDPITATCNLQRRVSTDGAKQSLELRGFNALAWIRRPEHVPLDRCRDPIRQPSLEHRHVVSLGETEGKTEPGVPRSTCTTEPVSRHIAGPRWVCMFRGQLG